MPVFVAVAPSGCTFHFSGVISLADLKRGVTDQVAARAWTRPLLMDTTKATGIAIRWDDIRTLVTFVRHHTVGLPPRGRTAILAPNDAVYGCARMYQVAAEEELSMVLGVVRTREEARHFLEAV